MHRAIKCNIEVVKWNNLFYMLYKRRGRRSSIYILNMDCALIQKAENELNFIQWIRKFCVRLCVKLSVCIYHRCVYMFIPFFYLLSSRLCFLWFPCCLAFANYWSLRKKKTLFWMTLMANGTKRKKLIVYIKVENRYIPKEILDNTTTDSENRNVKIIKQKFLLS